jgi:SAM-dependent methyltransferase
MSVHPSAAVGFELGATAYDRARPDYAAAAVADLRSVAGLGPGALVLDVGAGTGKWTRALAATDARLVALEPVAAMRAVLQRDLPGVPAVAGTAEALPFATGRFDVVTAAAAIHWFDLDRAVPELVRVVRPGGHVVAARNQRIPDGWVVDYDRIVEAARASVPSAAKVPWRRHLADHPALTPVAELAHPNDQPLDRELLVERTRSISFVAALPDPDRDALLAAVRRLAAGLPETFTMPSRTELVVLRRDPSGGDR